MSKSACMVVNIHDDEKSKLITKLITFLQPGVDVINIRKDAIHKRLVHSAIGNNILCIHKTVWLFTNKKKTNYFLEPKPEE